MQGKFLWFQGCIQVCDFCFVVPSFLSYPLLYNPGTGFTTYYLGVTMHLRSTMDIEVWVLTFRGWFSDARLPSHFSGCVNVCTGGKTTHCWRKQKLPTKICVKSEAKKTKSKNIRLLELLHPNLQLLFSTWDDSKRLLLGTGWLLGSRSYFFRLRRSDRCSV